MINFNNICVWHNSIPEIYTFWTIFYNFSKLTIFQFAIFLKPNLCKLVQMYLNAQHSFKGSSLRLSSILFRNTGKFLSAHHCPQAWLTSIWRWVPPPQKNDTFRVCILFLQWYCAVIFMRRWGAHFLMFAWPARTREPCWHGNATISGSNC